MIQDRSHQLSMDYLEKPEALTTLRRNMILKNVGSYERPSEETSYCKV